MHEQWRYDIRGDHGTGGDYDDGQRPCARGERCADATTVRQDDRTLLREAALGYRTLCDRDRAFLVRCLDDLPKHYAALHRRIGDKGIATGERVTGTASAPIPLNIAISVWLDEIVLVVASWCERVEDVARLAGVTQIRRLHPDAIVESMCVTLSAHVDVLLSLPAEPMTRFVTISEAADYAAAGVPGQVHPDAGYAEVIPDLDGGDAADEFIRIHSRCRRMLGLVGKDIELPVACPSEACGWRGYMVRPDLGTGLADYAQCNRCGDTVTGDAYTRLIREAAAREAAQKPAKEAS